MTATTTRQPAITSDRDLYDQRYAGDYRSTLSGYEVARFEEHNIARH